MVDRNNPSASFSPPVLPQSGTTSFGWPTYTCSPVTRGLRQVECSNGSLPLEKIMIRSSSSLRQFPHDIRMIPATFNKLKFAQRMNYLQKDHLKNKISLMKIIRKRKHWLIEVVNFAWRLVSFCVPNTPPGYYWNLFPTMQASTHDTAKRQWSAKIASSTE